MVNLMEIIMKNIVKISMVLAAAVALLFSCAPLDRDDY